MSAAQVGVALSLLSEPTVLVSIEGVVEASNVAARTLLGPGDPAISLVARAVDPAKVRAQLIAWSRSTQPHPGVLRLHANQGQVDFFAAGRRASAAESKVLVRLAAPADSNRRFRALSDKVDQLRAEVVRRTKAEARLVAQARLLETIARGTSLSETLDAIARFAEDESPEGTLCSILLVDRGTLRHGAAPNLPKAYVDAVDGTAIGPAVGSCGTAAFRREPVVVDDIATDPLWADYKALALAHGLRACWSTPVRSRSGEVLATVAHYSRQPSTPDELDHEIVDAACHFAGIAIERYENERQLQERAEALAEMDARKNEFLAMLGHELRNPLSSLVITAELLSGSTGTVEQQHEWLAVLQRQLGLVRRLVDDLLDVARVTRGKVDLRPAPVDLSALVDIAGRAHAARDKRVRTTITSDPCWVDGDSDRLQQVVENLLHNAQKFTPPEGTIAVSVDTDGAWARLRVKDTGEGIDPAKIPTMFELFAQGDRSLERAQGGLGLGLTRARSLVHGHGGTIEARSDGRGRGCEFIVRLPLRVPPAASPGVRPDAPPSQRSADVLVVDDDVDSAELLCLLLEAGGLGPPAPRRARRRRRVRGRWRATTRHGRVGHRAAGDRRLRGVSPAPAHARTDGGRVHPDRAHGLRAGERRGPRARRGLRRLPRQTRRRDPTARLAWVGS